MTSEEKIFSVLDEIQASQKRVEARMDQMEIRQEQVEARQERMETRQEETENWQKKMEERLDRIEATLARVAVTLENEVMRDIHLLAEGHSALVEKMATKDEAEELREKDAFLEGEIRALSKRVYTLEQAKEPA